MKIFYHPEQMLHHPQSYFSRGKMREPQEKPARMEEFLKAVTALGLPLMLPEDIGGIVSALQRVTGKYLEEKGKASTSKKKASGSSKLPTLADISKMTPEQQADLLSDL